MSVHFINDVDGRAYAPNGEMTINFGIHGAAEGCFRLADIGDNVTHLWTLEMMRSDDDERDLRDVSVLGAGADGWRMQNPIDG